MPPKTHTMTLLIDRDGTVIMASSGAARLLGCEPADLEGCRLHELIDSPGQDVVEAFLRSIRLATARPPLLAVTIRLSAGGRAEADLHVLPSAGAAGAPVEDAGVALLRIEMRAGAGAPRDGSGDIDPGSIAGEAVLICRNEAIVHAEEAAAGMTGIPAGELTNLTIKDLVAPEDLLPVVEALRAIERDGGTSEFGFRLFRTGHRVPLEVVARVRGVTWRGAQAVVVGLRDISRELRSARFATERIEHLNAALAASGEAVILLGDPSGGWPVVLVTDGVGRLFDRDVSGWPGRRFREVWEILRPLFDEPETEERIWLGMLDDPDAVRVDNVGLAGAPRRILERSSAPMHGADGSIIGRICTFRDVTRRSQAEEALIRSREEARRAREELEGVHQELLLANEGLEKRMGQMREMNESLRGLVEMRSNLLANVSHDLQTPLVSIRALTEMILRGSLGEVNADQRASLETALRNIDRLIGLIRNLLAFARDQAREQPLRIESFALDGAMAEAVEVVRESAASRRIALETAVPAGIVVLADREKILRVLINLLGNAIKYNRDGGRVTVDAEDAPGTAVRVRVRDTGVGIAAQDLERIFERGTRVGGSAPGEGDGLGLAIARDLLREHGCVIRVESEPGKGSLFTFTVPKDRAAARGISSLDGRSPVAGPRRD